MNEEAVDPGALIQTFDVCKRYPSAGGVLDILQGVNFTMQPGEMCFIIGRSGSGKSTLMHLLGGLDQATSGKIFFEGANITAMGETKLARIRNRRIGFVFQFFHLLSELTLLENVMLPSIIAGKKDRKWAQEVLRRVKLSSRKDHYPSQLSGGEQQRAAVARALVNRPALVFCDEPTGNLDQETADDMLSLLNDLNRHDGQSFLIVTHDEALAWRYDRVLRLIDGVLLPADRGSVSAGEKS